MKTDLQSVYLQLIQSEQLRGLVSFDRACRELHFRCEAIRADEFLDSRASSEGKGLTSVEGKQKGQQGQTGAKLPCLNKDCLTMIQECLPLCKVCYLQCMAGKTTTLVLRDNLGTAKFNSEKKKIDFPVGVPISRFPKKGFKKKVFLAVPTDFRARRI
jgi:hypothetical protein